MEEYIDLDDNEIIDDNAVLLNLQKLGHKVIAMPITSTEVYTIYSIIQFIPNGK